MLHSLRQSRAGKQGRTDIDTGRGAVLRSWAGAGQGRAFLPNSAWQASEGHLNAPYPLFRGVLSRWCQCRERRCPAPSGRQPLDPVPHYVRHQCDGLQRESRRAAHQERREGLGRLKWCTIVSSGSSPKPTAKLITSSYAVKRPTVASLTYGRATAAMARLRAPEAMPRVSLTNVSEVRRCNNCFYLFLFV